MKEMDERKLGAYQLWDVRFADDYGMVDSTEKVPYTIMDKLTVTARTYDMKINLNKTEVMKVCRK